MNRPFFSIGERVRVVANFLHDNLAGRTGVVTKIDGSTHFVYFPSLHMVHSLHKGYLQHINDNISFREGDLVNFLLNENDGVIRSGIIGQLDPNHPNPYEYYLIKSCDGREHTIREDLIWFIEGNTAACTICLRRLSERKRTVVTSCGHMFCHRCVNRMLDRIESDETKVVRGEMRREDAVQDRCAICNERNVLYDARFVSITYDEDNSVVCADCGKATNPNIDMYIAPPRAVCCNCKYHYNLGREQIIRATDRVVIPFQ